MNIFEFFEEISIIYNRSYSGNLVEEELIVDMNNKRIVSCILALASLVLSIMNIFKGYSVMTFTTLFLTLSFAFCIHLCKDIKNYRIVNIIMSGAIIINFSYYAVSGQNEGFAILWTLLVPSLTSLLLGIRLGFCISVYFEVLFLLLFYTPIRNYVGHHYTATFMNRYPILYMVCILSNIYLAIRKEYYRQRTTEMAYEDGLVGLHNRLYYEKELKKYTNTASFPSLTIYTIDVNRLKYTNDNYGHQVGDALLIAVSTCLKKCFSKDDVICRIGGDEFTVITFSDKESRTAANQKLDKFVFRYLGEEIKGPSLSYGSASVRDYPGLSIEELVKKADFEMYKAKEAFYKNSGFDRRSR